MCKYAKCYFQARGASAKITGCSVWDKKFVNGKGRVVGRCRSCFPATALVTVRAKQDGDDCYDCGKTVPIAHVKKGQLVRSVDTHGKLVWSSVLHLPHKRNHQMTPFLEITYRHLNELQQIFTVSPDHLVYRFHLGTNETKKDAFVLPWPVKASDLTAGDDLLLSSSFPSPGRIVTIRRVFQPGAYTLYTANTRIIVNGVVCSGFSDHGLRSVDYQVYRIASSVFHTNVAETITAMFIKFVTESQLGQAARTFFRIMMSEFTCP